VDGQRIPALPDNVDELETDYQAAEQADRDDPLRFFRDRFAGLRKDLIYLDGNSLGPLPKATFDLAAECVSEEWGTHLIQSWNKSWFTLPEQLGDLLAPLIGASPGSVCFADSVTVNLYKLAGGAVALEPHKTEILTDTLNFPSDYYALEGLPGVTEGTMRVKRVVSDDGISIDAGSLCEAIREETALVTLSHVTFKSGFRHDLALICRRARERGALVLADLSHSVGAVPIDLEGWGVDLGVGCAYKYLNGGPGAPAFLYVRKGLQERLPVIVPGWFGADRPFTFAPHFAPAPGIRRFLVGTPPILSLRAVEPGIQLLREAGMDAVWTKSRELSNALIHLYDQHLVSRGFHLGSPRDPQQRGSHIALRHAEAFRINQALIHPVEGRPVIIPDFREPDNLRLGIAPLYVSHLDMVRTVQRLIEIVDTKEYKRFHHDLPAVT